MERKSIVVGVLRRDHQVLIAQRQRHQAYADYWEFPGGKVEAGEGLEDALVREFKEEVGVKTNLWRPLIVIPWEYEHASVLLNVFVCDEFEGEPHGAEGQTVKWVAEQTLENYPFPEANQGIVTALRLPDRYVITGNFHDADDGLTRLEAALENGLRLVQLRAKQLEEDEFFAFAKPAIALVHRYHGKVLINGKPEWLTKLPEADGLQLASTAIMDWVERPIAKDKLLSISTHTEAEIAKALELNADVLLLSPVNETSSHPGEPALGWALFNQMIAQVPIPVYALGGVSEKDVVTAKVNGAQGVAAISAFWPQPI